MFTQYDIVDKTLNFLRGLREAGLSDADQDMFNYLLVTGGNTMYPGRYLFKKEKLTC